MEGPSRPGRNAPPDLRIRRKWIDGSGRLWYVVRGPLAETGYPVRERPAAFARALSRALPPLPPDEPAPPPLLGGPTAEEIQGILNRARLEPAR